jgi:hypothetical protein
MAQDMKVAFKEMVIEDLVAVGSIAEMRRPLWKAHHELR